jgi:hypothetical protein
MYKDYLNAFVFSPEDDQKNCILTLKRDPYIDVRVTLGNHFRFNHGAGTTNLEFDYDIQSTPDNFDLTLLNDDFRRLLGHIILCIVEERMCQETSTANNDDQDSITMQVMEQDSTRG